MKVRFYAKLGWDAILRNRRLFIPFLLSSAFMVLMEYILFFLIGSQTIQVPMGAEMLNLMLRLGTFVVAVFALIFLMYTQAFLIRNRLGEFGLYYVLGFNRKDLSRVLLWQTLYCYLISAGTGLVLGILFSKLAELAFLNLIHSEIGFDLNIDLSAVVYTLILFGVIFVILYLESLWQIHRKSGVELLKNASQAEKAPKGNWLIAICGFGLLIFSYVSAVQINNPLDSLIWFFGLVILVILATYMIMISGTVFLVNLLKKNKGFYYKSEHFISLSSIAFRLKRNGAGLASICILTTMVLVTLSSTAALYFGTQQALETRYPREMNIDFRFTEAKNLQNDNLETLKGNLETLLEEQGVEMENILSYSVMSTAGLLIGEDVYLDPNEVEDSYSNFSNIRQFFFTGLEQYERETGKTFHLEKGQALAYSNRGEIIPKELDFGEGVHFEIVEQLDEFEVPGSASMMITNSIMLVLEDPYTQLEPIEKRADFLGESLLSKQFVLDFDFTSQTLSSEQITRLLVNEYGKQLGEDGLVAVEIEDRESEIVTTYIFFGGFFFVGLMLSLVFALETVMIIYYKQISEGIEDQGRFEIMQRIGLNRSQILKSIKDQLLIVFFLPLLFSLVNLGFAFPVVEKLLLLFNLNNPSLFLWTNILSAGLFTVFYLGVYLLTTREYYRMIRT